MPLTVNVALKLIANLSENWITIQVIILPVLT